MALRKTPRADLRRSAPLVAQLSLALALLVVLAAFRSGLQAEPPTIETPPPPDVITIETIVQTDHRREPPPPPRPPALVEEVKDDIELPDVDVDLDPHDLPLAPLGPPPQPQQPERAPEPEQPDVFRVVEEQPQLIGGLEALHAQIVYPEAARLARIEGKVTVQFVVDEEGRVRDAEVLRGIGGGCDEAALRAVEAMRFTPGKQRGKAVKVQMTLPITFRLR